MASVKQYYLELACGEHLEKELTPVVNAAKPHIEQVFLKFFSPQLPGPIEKLKYLFFNKLSDSQRIELLIENTDNLIEASQLFKNL